MLKNIHRSLTDLAGEEYIDSVCHASAALGIAPCRELRRIADEPVEFWPEKVAAQVAEIAQKSGEHLTDGLASSNPGATTAAFAHAFHRGAAPLSGLGTVRIGEDGRIAIIGKSEHYQAVLGHNFPGFKLLEHARRIGITNLAHNNSRGHLTRKLERELIRIANGLAKSDMEGLEKIIASTEKHVMNRVINLETGSLACEAAFKMSLARFYRLQPDFPAPGYSGKIPVFVVMADFMGGRCANYHGTTVVTQLMRGLWPELCSGMIQAGLLEVAPCRINDPDDFRRIVDRYDSGKYKIALFTHELVLMNYGGIRLEDEFVRITHKICDEHDIPVFVDEIQSCMWSPEIFLFREYNCRPDFVSVGKGFPAGQYPASKILAASTMDNLNQFGALVTNGQEELASLANLITMEFAGNNSEHTAAISRIWRKKLHDVARLHADILRKIDGDGLLTSLVFKCPETAIQFCKILEGRYAIDVSVQTYKQECPPAALLKLPLVTEETQVDYVVGRISDSLAMLKEGNEK